MPLPAPDAAEASPLTTQQELDERGWRASWLLSSIWLLFACFAIISLWFSEDLSQLRKITATVIALGFVVTYAVGFRQLIRHGFGGGSRLSFARTAWSFQIALIVLTAAGMFVGGWALLGLMPYVVGFAVFTLAWRETAVIAVLGIAFTVLAPLLAGVYGDLWVLTPVTIAVTFGMILIRVVETNEHNRALLQTELVVSDERNRVARDVHDVLGHSLTAVVLKAELAERLLGQLTPTEEADRAVVERCREELIELQAVSRRALSEIRSTVGGLRNPDLADEVAVARTVLADAGVSLAVIGEPGSVPEQYRSTLAWVVREAVTNVVRHAQAENCTVEFGAEPTSLVRITDDGVGPGVVGAVGPEGADAAVAGNGIQGLQERARAAGTSLTVEPVDAETGGTRVEVRL